METNECLENNGGCWQDNSTNITACRVFYLFFSNLMFQMLMVYLILAKSMYVAGHFPGEGVPLPRGAGS